MATIVLENITYYIEDKTLVDNFSYNFLTNKVYAFVGKDNSGIDALFDLIACNIHATEGDVYFEGSKKGYQNSEKICYIKDLPNLLTINKIFEKLKTKYEKFDTFFAYTVISGTGINVDSRYQSLSDRNKDIVKTVCTIASNAEVKILYNPCEKADLKIRGDIYNLIYKHQELNPTTYLIATNIIDEVSFAIDDILLINDGKLIEHLTTDQARRSFFEVRGKTEVVRSLITGMKIIGYEERGQELSVCTSQKLTKDLTRKFQKYMVKVSEVNIQQLLIYLLAVKEKKQYFE